MAALFNNAGTPKKPLTEIAVALVILVIGTSCSSDSMLDESEPTDMTSEDSEGVDNVVSMPETQLPVPSAPQAANSLIEFAAQLYIAETQTATDNQLSAAARFYRLTTPLETPPELRTMSALDVCEIGSEASQLSADSLNFPIDHMIESVDVNPVQVMSITAGQSVELTQSAGSFLSLFNNIDPDDATQYVPETGVQLGQSVPDELTADVAGDEFPQLQWQWNKPEALEPALRDALRSVSSSPDLVWNAASGNENTQSRVHIYAGHINEVTGEFRSYQCELEDDGAFRLPADIQALYSNGFVAQFVDIARYTRSIQMLNDIPVVNVYFQKR